MRLPYLPSRGARNRDADTWVPLDPSYKQYQVLTGLDAAAISGIDLNAVAQTTVNSATTNAAEGWISGLDPTALKNAQTQMQSALQTYIGQHYSQPTVGDILGGYKTILEEFLILPFGLQNRTVKVAARYGALPAKLENTVTYAFDRDELGYPLDPVTLPLPKLNNQRLVLSFKPATPADEQVLQSLLPQGEITDPSQLPQAIPAYLIQVIPELKLNNEVIKTGAAMRLGDELPFFTQVNYAGRALPAKTYNVIAGSYLAVAAESGNIGPAQLQAVQARLTQTKGKLESADATLIGSLTREDILGDLFQAGLLGYYAQLIGFSHVLGLQQHGHYNLAAGIGTYGYEPDVNYFFGIPRALKPGGAAMNVPIFHIAGQGANDSGKKRDYLFQVGLMSSALEHAVPEQMFVDAQHPGEAISAVKALQKANAAGQRIYHITPANQAALANIHHNSLVMDEIRNALAAGKEVITHTDAVSVPGWSGAGYILFDPNTGDGAFKIGGGMNGGFKSILLGLLFIVLFEALVVALFSLGLVLFFSPILVQASALLALGVAFLEITRALNQDVMRAFLVNVAYGVLSTAVLALLPWTAAAIAATVGAEAIASVVVGLIFSWLNAVHAYNQYFNHRRREYA